MTYIIITTILLLVSIPISIILLFLYKRNKIIKELDNIKHRIDDFDYCLESIKKLSLHKMECSVSILTGKYRYLDELKEYSDYIDTKKYNDIVSRIEISNLRDVVGIEDEAKMMIREAKLVKKYGIEEGTKLYNRNFERNMSMIKIIDGMGIDEYETDEYINDEVILTYEEEIDGELVVHIFEFSENKLDRFKTRIKR